MTRFLQFIAIGAALLPQTTTAAEPPRVLFLGDPVHQQMIDAAAKELKDRVRIEYPPSPAGDTGTALARIDEMLGTQKWDLIYFNFGLGDLFYKDPRTREVRSLSKHAGGVRVTPPEIYAQNLDALVVRLKATGAKLVWATTTPLVNLSRGHSPCDRLLDPGSEVEYNRIASQVMARHRVPTNDIHAHVLAQFGPNDKHPPFEGYAKDLSQKKSPLHEPVVRMILSQLGGRVPNAKP